MRGHWLIRALAAALFMVAAHAQALTLTPAGTTCTSNINSDFGAAAVEAWVLSCLGKDLNLSLFYKADFNDDGPAFESGPFAGSYQTTFFNTLADPSDALIDYISGLAIVCPECFLVVKDGNQTPAQYLFDIGSWNGTDDLILSGFWPNQGAISNVAIWGGAPARQVSAPGTIALLGLAIAGLAFVARRKAR